MKDNLYPCLSMLSTYIPTNSKGYKLKAISGETEEEKTFL